MTYRTVMFVNMECYKCKRVALQSVTRMDGIDSISINMKEKTLTVVGEADPVDIGKEVKKKFPCARLISSGPPPPPPPPPNPKEEPKKPDEKKDDEKKDDENNEKKNEEKKEEPEQEKEKEKKEDNNPGEKKNEDTNQEPIKPSPQEPINPSNQQVVYYPIYPPCILHGSSSPPAQRCGCGNCSSREDILWPRYHPPRAPPNEVWYVWNEENQNSCTIS